MAEITLTINGESVTVPEGTTIMEAADKLGVYIPRLCSHPDLPTSKGLKPNEFIYRGNEKILNDEDKEYEGCKLCIVKVEGIDGFVTSCNTEAKDGMVVTTDSEEIKKQRKDNLFPILKDHPHACLLCAQQEGCTRLTCSSDVPEEERCCVKLGNCEVQRIANYIGIREDMPKYVPAGLPILDDEPLFTRDYNLCIGCTRCVRVCREVRGIEAIGFVFKNGKIIVGTTTSPTLAESGCKFCTACVEVCPTGALLDKRLFKPGEKEDVLVPCRANCPANIDIPLYLRWIRDKKYDEALAVIKEKVPFPNVLGYICFHPCEDVCRRGEVNEPIAICALKRFSAENGGELWKSKLTKPTPTGKKVAVIGAGPAGLTAAYYLARKGHKVTLMETTSELGGMMRNAIPRYRLPIEVLEHDINDILEQDIEVKKNLKMDETIPHKLKENGYDAVFIAVGSQLSRSLNIDGMNLNQVKLGVDFLKAINRGEKVEVANRVVVIGGGNVAVDVARSALRLGAKEVKMVCLENDEEMPAHKWEVKDCKEEGIEIDIRWGPKRILSDDGKNVKGIELVKCTSVFDEEGRFAPKFDESTTKSIDTDMVILAIGQASDLSFLGENSPIEVTPQKIIKVNPETFETSVSGIFAGGEIVLGPASVIDAIASGRKAAISIDKYLGGDGDITEKLSSEHEYNPWFGKEEGFASLPRVKMPALSPEERIKNFNLIELGFNEDQALEEAKRCLNCDYRLMFRESPHPPHEWVEFTEENVEQVPDEPGVYQLLDEDKKVIAIKGMANIKEGLKEALETVEKAKYFIYELDGMYSKRESELLQQYLQKYGELPSGGDELDDLF